MTLLFEMPGTLALTVIYTAMGLFIISQIFYLMTMQSTFGAIAPAHRTMPPGQVWLQLIPLFGLVWGFIIVNNLERSIQAEEKARDVRFTDVRPSYTVGLAMCILKCLFFVPVLSIIFGLAALACWIVYWVSAASFKNHLIMAGSSKVEPSL